MLRFWRLKPSPALKKALRYCKEGESVIVVIGSKQYSAYWEKMEFEKV